MAVRYALGFERMIRQAVLGFEKIGLKASIYRSASGVHRNGYFGAIPNKQYDFDHKDDAALYMFVIQRIDPDDFVKNLLIVFSHFRRRESNDRKTSFLSFEPRFLKRTGI